MAVNRAVNRRSRRRRTGNHRSLDTNSNVARSPTVQTSNRPSQPLIIGGKARFRPLTPNPNDQPETSFPTNCTSADTEWPVKQNPLRLSAVTSGLSVQAGQLRAPSPSKLFGLVRWNFGGIMVLDVARQRLLEARTPVSAVADLAFWSGVIGQATSGAPARRYKSADMGGLSVLRGPVGGGQRMSRVDGSAVRNDSGSLGVTVGRQNRLTLNE